MTETTITSDAETHSIHPRLPDWAWIILAGSLIMFSFLGSADIGSSHEARVATVARQMLDTGDWLIPVIGEEIRLKKPPLAYWLAALASYPFGEVSETTARIPNALAGVGAMLLVWWLERRLWSARAGVLAALAFGTTAEVWEMSRSAGIEMPMLFFNLAALCCWRHGREQADGERSPWGWIGCYGCLALSFLEKGPVGPLVVGLVIAAWLTLEDGWRTRGGGMKAHLGGALLFLAMVVPWFLAVLYRMPEAQTIWFTESAGRFEGFDHLQPPYYFLVKVLGDGLPWWVAALAGLWLLRGQPDAWKRSMRIALVWATMVLVFFSIPHCKKAYYILFAYPPLALAAGAVFDRLLDGDAPAGVSRAVRWVYGSIGIIVLGAGVAAVPLFSSMLAAGRIKPVYAGLQPFVPYMACGFVVLGGVLAWACWRTRFRALYLALFLGTIGAMAAYILTTPTLNGIKGDKRISQYIQTQQQDGDRLVTCNVSGFPTYLFYLGEELAHVENIAALYRQYCLPPATGRTYALMREKEIRRFSRIWILTPTHPSQADGNGVWEQVILALANTPEVEEVLTDTGGTLRPQDLKPGLWATNPPQAIAVRLIDCTQAVKGAGMFILGSDVRALRMDTLFTPLRHAEVSSKVRWVQYPPAPTEERPHDE